MNETIKKALIYGSIFSIIYIFLTLTSQFLFSKNFTCIPCAVMLFLINFFPLYILNIGGWWIYVVSTIFYFFVGALVGYLIQKYRK